MNQMNKQELTEPTEARQDELAGIKTGVVEIICEACLPYICAHWNKPAEERIGACRPLKNWVERWFALTVSSGGICKECYGMGILEVRCNAPKCPTCSSTGSVKKEEISIGDLIKEWKDGHNTRR